MAWKSNDPVCDQPTTVSASLEQLARKLGTAPPKDLTRVMGSWPGLVGPEVARHTTPVSLKSGELVVAVDSSHWLVQLRWMSSSITQKINDRIGREVVEHLVLRLR